MKFIKIDLLIQYYFIKMIINYIKPSKMPRSEYTYGTPAYSRRIDYNNYRINHTFSQIRDDSARHRRETSRSRSNNTTRPSYRSSSPDLGGINSSNPATSTCAKICYTVLFGLLVVLLIVL
jgi:hypothetical protein